MDAPSPLPRQAYLAAASDVLRSLQVQPDEGLSQSRIARQRNRYGANVMPGKSHWRLLPLFFDRFRDILVLVLLLAGIVSLLLGRIGDTIIIAIALLLDVVLSFAQVWRTERTLATMQSRVEDTVTVMRDGTTQTIPSSQLVVGDVIELRAGERVPADARVIKVDGLRTQEAMLTGEATDIAKESARLTSRAMLSDQRNMLFAGTSVVNGSGQAIVVAVGTKTEFGKIAQMFKAEHSPDSPLRRKLQRTGLVVGWAIIAAVALLSTVGLLKGDDLVETGHTAITLIVSAIPEDLTMILTIALTVGVTRILRKGGVVRKLASGEALGAATVICTDKTGTLTQGSMKATNFNCLQGDIIEEGGKLTNPWHELALIGFALASSAHRRAVRVNENETKKEEAIEYVGSATERTALAFVEQFGYEQRALQRQWRGRDSLSFSPRWKYRAALVDHPTQSTGVLFVSGAPDVLLEKSVQTLNEDGGTKKLTSQRRYQLQKKIEGLAGDGRRLIAIAVRRHMQSQTVTHDDVNNLVFLGVLPIQDPVRPEVRQAITQALAAGVVIKLVTGDHAATAKAVARQVGLTVTDDQIISGSELAGLDDQELTARMKNTVIFARVEPLDKQRIVRALQRQGEVVAMTGDGVNDTVALKSADIGVAMAAGADVARDAADLVLLDNSFATIVAAIREGRVIRDNIRKVIAFLLATNVAEVAIFFVSLMAGLPLPLLPAQILWINLVTDGTSDIALSLEPAEDNVMRRSPENPKAALLGRHLFHSIGYSGLIMTAATMALFWYWLRMGADVSYARTMAFTFLSVASLLSVWSFRSLTQPVIRQGLFRNKWVPISAGFSLSLHLLAIYVPAFRSFFDTVPLKLSDWLLIAAAAVVTVAAVDMRKIIFRQFSHQTGQSRLGLSVNQAIST